MEDIDAIAEVYAVAAVLKYCAENAPAGLGQVLKDQCERLENAAEKLELDEMEE